MKALIEVRVGRRDHRALEAAVDEWYSEVKKADRSSMADVKRLYGTARVILADRIVFNIEGNSYRLVVSVDFVKAIVFIIWIGTHTDYEAALAEVERLWVPSRERRAATGSTCSQH